MECWGTQRTSIVADLGLDTPDQLPVFDQIVATCAAVLRTPHAAFAVQTADGPFLKATHGLDQRRFSQPLSFCEQARQLRDAFVVPDARHDPRYCNDPLVIEAPAIRFYAGTSVRAPNGEVIGSLCAMASYPRICMRTDLDAFLNLRDTLEQVLVLQQAAITDPLTGTLRRSYFNQRLNEACRHAGRQAQPLSLLLVNLDHLDRYGHTYGQHEVDRIVTQVSRQLQSHARRPGDLVARLDANLFGILLPHTDQAHAREIGERLLAQIHETGFLHETAPLGRLTVSVGGSVVNVTAAPENLAEQLFDQACRELALQQAAGGNGLRFADRQLVGSLAANTDGATAGNGRRLSSETARPESSA